MDMSFASRKVQKLCSSEKERRGKLGPRNAELLERRMDQLEAAQTLEDMRSLPAVRCHELRHDRKGQLAVDLVHPKRLVFQPNHDPVPYKEDGGLDWSRVTAILILEVVDYH